MEVCTSHTVQLQSTLYILYSMHSGRIALRPLHNAHCALTTHSAQHTLHTLHIVQSAESTPNHPATTGQHLDWRDTFQGNPIERSGSRIVASCIGHKLLHKFPTTRASIAKDTRGIDAGRAQDCGLIHGQANVRGH